MEIKRFTLSDILAKTTDIRRERYGKVINNYYYDCDESDVLYGVIGKRTVVFWYDDNRVCRVHFNSSDKDELSELLTLAPDGSAIDYITREDNEHSDIFTSAGYLQKYTMIRMAGHNHCDPEWERAQAERTAILKEQLYRPENVREAEERDLQIVYDKLYEVFNEDESHLPSIDELLQLIKNEWVTVYFEEDELKALTIFKVEKEKIYGYQTWNSTGPEGYFSLVFKAAEMQENAKRKAGIKGNANGYCWVNRKNKSAKRLIEFWGNEFDGLYDNVYVKK